MYSDKLEMLFKKNKIEVGDKIKIINDYKVIEGILMPRPDFGDNNIIVIKLSNGYNIGIKYTEKILFEKVSKHKKEEFLFPKIKVDENLKSNNNITLLYTGGTIGSKIDYATGGVYMLTKPEELLHEVPELKNIANITVKHLMSVASEDISYIDWQKMASSAAEAFNSGSKGVVITHGTDTMHYTSAALSFMLNDLNGPVVLTGAQRSSDRGSSDAFMNLICSANLAAKSNIKEVGICMHATHSDDYCNFIRGTKVRKMHTSSRDAFKPINSKPMAKIYQNGKIEIEEDVEVIEEEIKNKKTTVKKGFEPKVALILTYPNSDPEIIEYYNKKNYKGIIIEGTGLGHAPVSTSHKEYNWLSSIKNGVSSGMIIGITSQCINGRVNGNVYRNGRLIQEAGAIYCEDMLPEVAYVKLGFLLGNHNKKESERLLPINIAGEITKKTEIISDE
ncbi:MAG: Glu-tRNA(Gln) amidotransferase subunit GatD [Candidatus Micrarchaeaceae archaeon]